MNLLPDFRKLLVRAEPEIDPDSDEAAAAYISGDVKGDLELRRAVRRPIRNGTLIVVGMFVVLLFWAFFHISGAVLAGGIVKVENNSKEVRRLEGGVVRKILVHEGQRVNKGQLLIQFDDTQGRASVDIFQSNVDSARAALARFQAEAANASDVTFPPELTSRAADPRVAALMATQRSLFQTRTLLFRSQVEVYQSQVQQTIAQLEGQRIQAQSVTDQGMLVEEELRDVRELSREGYAPESRLLALERNAVDVKGRRGSMAQDMAAARQKIGETKLRLASLQNDHQREVADGIRQAQDQLAEYEPKLKATMEQVSQTELYAPVTGYVFNLTQFTEGGVAGAGQLLMQIVPANAKMIVSCEVEPKDIADVKVGMPARVTITAYSSRTTPPINGTVTLVSADAKVNEKTGKSAFGVDVTITPAQLAEAGPEVKLTPGMQAQVAIVTGSRSILGYLLQPFTNAIKSSMREK